MSIQEVGFFMAESFTFQAEIRQLLYTLVHSLYTEREIFLRELISNASDALNRMQFELLTNRDVRDVDAQLAIEIEANEEAGTLTIRDTGVGMTRQELIENLGTISKSGVRAFLEQAKSTNGHIATDLIGQFGVGFYSIFMVADEVTVNTLSYQPDSQAYRWISRGEESYEIEEGDKDVRGTEVILKLKDDAKDFLKEYTLRKIIQTHSNYIAFPIYIGESEEPANARQAIWRRPASEVSDEDYHNFYRALTMDFEAPLAHIHTSADAPVQYYALLYLPAKAERNMFSLRKEPGLQLYARKVLIQDYCTDLLPEYLYFVQGAVDSEDLPLNVSRETVQANKLMAGLKKAITGRILRYLNDLAKNDVEKYAAFWAEFGPFLKQGMIADPDNRDRLQALLRFYSTRSEDTLTSLQDYVERMQEVENQQEIYYVLGDSKSVASHSPHLDPFRERGIEVLYFTETVDSFLINSLFEFNGHKLRNVDDESLDLSEIGSPQEPEATNESLEEDSLEGVRSRFADILGDRVQSVRISKVLTGNNPARLVSPEGTLDRHTQRVYRLLERDYEVPRKILELNPRHTLMHNLANLMQADAENPLVEVTVEQIYENALLLDGLHPNPAEMVSRIQALMEAATGRHSD
ncbi:MAG: molecular chaperone HtpG [Chloroflexi bacterium]|nr:molecular chaperone HtpG [Chloroflexota bacterium]NOG66100.1 molecular chaperone HtpG [Chloroflexota bacterium]